MKKLVLLAMATMVVFVACKKDGIYNPKKKISKITTIRQIEEPTPVGTVFDNRSDTNISIWKWDKNRLQQIIHPNWYENFVYDKCGRLIRVEDAAGDEYTYYEYNGAKLSKVIYYDEGTRYTKEYALEYNGKNLTKITITAPQMFRSVNKEQSPLLAVCEPAIAQIIENNIVATAAQSTQKASVFTSTVSLEWSGKNISKITYEENGEMYTCEMTYDDKINPYNGFLGLYFDDNYKMENYKNKNNIKSITSKMRGETQVVNFEYEYDGQWPTKITQTGKLYPWGSGKTYYYIEYKNSKK